MKCKECHNHHRKGDPKWGRICEDCERMQKAGDWLWEIDNGMRMAKCPGCGGRMTIDIYAYWNPYRFCPYCGRLNQQQETLHLAAM